MTIDTFGTTGSQNDILNTRTNKWSIADVNYMQQLMLQSPYPASYNRRIVLTPRPDIGRVVIKIVEKNTDRVIKELPPVALQHVYRHIRLLLEKPA